MAWKEEEEKEKEEEEEENEEEEEEEEEEDKEKDKNKSLGWERNAAAVARLNEQCRPNYFWFCCCIAVNFAVVRSLIDSNMLSLIHI